MKLLGIIALICVVILTVVMLKTEQGYHRATVSRDTVILAGVLKEWVKAGEPQGGQLQELLSSYGSFKPFSFQKTVEISGTNYQCMFAMKDVRFRNEGEMMAITRDGAVLWLGVNSTNVLSRNALKRPHDEKAPELQAPDQD